MGGGKCPPPARSLRSLALTNNQIKQNIRGGAMRGSEATERGRVWTPSPPPPTVGRFLKMCMSNWHFLYIKCHGWG